MHDIYLVDFDKKVWMIARRGGLIGDLVKDNMWKEPRTWCIQETENLMVGALFNNIKLQQLEDILVRWERL